MFKLPARCHVGFQVRLCIRQHVGDRHLVGRSPEEEPVPGCIGGQQGAGDWLLSSTASGVCAPSLVQIQSPLTRTSGPMQLRVSARWHMRNWSPDGWNRMNVAMDWPGCVTWPEQSGLPLSLTMRLTER